MPNKRRNPLNLSIKTLKRPYYWSGSALWYMGLFSFFILINQENLYLKAIGALLGAFVCGFLGAVCLRVGIHQDKRTNYVKPEKKNEFSPFVFNNMGALLIVFSISLFGVVIAVMA